jgi:hypothetical protein
MLFDKLFYARPEATFAQKSEAFIAELLKIEKEYLSFFKKTGLPQTGRQDQIKNHYFLKREFEYIRFDYLPGSDLPENIKTACDAAYQKVWGNN